MKYRVPSGAVFRVRDVDFRGSPGISFPHRHRLLLPSSSTQTSSSSLASVPVSNDLTARTATTSGGSLGVR